jgi:ATP-dependent Clp protease protease subunit
VIEGTRGNERIFDIYSLLLKERIVFLGLPITDQVANLTIAELLYLEREAPDKDISLYVHCPGGVISAGLAIYDTMQLVRCDVSTICVGLAASMGTIILASGTKGKRFALPNATVHLHQAVGGAQGQAADVAIAAKEIMRIQDKIREILVQHTGQPMDKITHDIDRDFYLSAEQAKEYGIVDDILTSPEKTK